MRRAFVVLLLAAATLVSPSVPMANGAVGTGSVTWTVDLKKKTITVATQIAIYLGPCASPPPAPEGAEGGPGTTGRDCSATADQIGQAIKADIESVWNGHFYKCYRLIFVVNVSVTTDRVSVDNNHVGVRIDRSVEAVRSYVESSFGSLSFSDHWQSNDPADRFVPDNGLLVPTTWGYPPAHPHTYAHEFGHVLGLDDQYVEGTWEPKPGAPSDLMWSSNTRFIDQSTVNRVVERNSDRLYDSGGKQLSLDDLTCEPQFRVTLKADQVEYDSSNVVDPPCTVIPITSSKDQSLKIDSSAPVDVRIVDVPEQGPGSYAIVPNFDVLTLQNSLTPGIRPPTAAGLFDMPINVQVTRRNDQPARAAVPALRTDPQTFCPGGSPGGSPIPKDCGVRSYDAWVAMEERSGSELWPVGSSLPSTLKDLGYSQARLDKLYKNCYGHTPWPGAFVDEAGGTVNAGKLPPLDQLKKVSTDWLTDGVPGKVEIEGTAELKANQPGTLIDDWFDWTLTFCPLNKDRETPPDCP